MQHLNNCLSEYYYLVKINSFSINFEFVYPSFFQQCSFESFFLFFLLFFQSFGFHFLQDKSLHILKAPSGRYILVSIYLLWSQYAHSNLTCTFACDRIHSAVSIYRRK